MKTNDSVRLRSPEEMYAVQINKNVARLAEIRCQQEALKAESDMLEGWFLTQAETKLRSTKVKTLHFAIASGERVNATMATSIKILYPSLLGKIFGEAYDDVVTVETTPKYKLSAPAQRMLAGLYLESYTQTSVEEILSQAESDSDKLAALKKKVKGASFETDKKYLMAISGLPEEAAETFAYFVAEAAIWENYQRLMDASQMTDADKDRVLQYINTAVVVEETPKISVEY